MFLTPTASFDNRKSSDIISIIIDTSSTFNFNETGKVVNGSFCHISSLEVYRGREQANEVNHAGFSLRDNGTIEVRQL